ncbi:MAG: sodium-translocating pyrophosphatase [Gammaproteobacteria bacterium]
MSADYLWIPIIMGVAGLSAALLLYRLVLRYNSGKPKAVAISNQIHRGAMTFMRQEYTWLLIFVALIAVPLFITLGPNTTVAFATGAISSALAGWLGMLAATRANVRTAVAAQQSAASALSVAFFGGSVMGLCVAALGLIGLGSLYIWLGGDPQTGHAIHGFGMGASCVALFSRVGGGIYTKSADIGADLVGKVEAGIPEDDPRNPGVIADNVGDNVGDIAGMGSDIFESYCGSMIACIAIAATTLTATSSAQEIQQAQALMLLPLLLSSAGLLSALLFIVVVRLRAGANAAQALRTATVGAPVAFIVLAWFLVQELGLGMNLWWSVVAGASGGILIGLVTEYYTGGPPVKKIARSGETGPATVMITGLAIGMQSVVIPVLGICAIIWVSTELSGLYGVGIAAVGMLATVGITMAIDAYGPVADNAGGIAVMADMGKKTREITDSLDELGNTTAAIGKGFAIGAAALAALAIIAAFVETVSASHPDFSLSLSDPLVLVGLFIGGATPFLIASITMTSVGDAAFEMINEIRRQFKEIPGLLEGKAEPDTERCITIATNAALRRMFLPAAIAVSLPPLVGFGLGAEALGGLLGGGLLGCVLMALMMANAGGAWDNAKKYIEKGNLGGKGSEVHSAAVVGDTVGDPFKDTSGPSMNILINVMSIVSLVIAPLLSL